MRAGRLRILIVGVGGQGALTAARLLGEAALSAGLPVIVGQLHGMSQRGGSVECPVLIGPGHSSHIANRKADILVGLEPMEVQRALPKLSEDTRVVLNRGIIVPFSLAVEGKDYPPVDQLIEPVRAITREVFEIDGPALVQKTGLPRTLNVVVLGAVAGLGMLPFDQSHLWTAIEKKVPGKYLQANRLAFDLGLKAVEKK